LVGLVLGDAWKQVWMLGASLVAFALLGASLVWYLRRRRIVQEDATLWQILFPFNRYQPGQLRVELWMLIKSRVLWFPIINAWGAAWLSVDLNATLIDAFGRRQPTINHSVLLLCVQVLLSYVALEFSGYWAHRVLHTVRVLWYTHRAHHSAEVLSFLTGGRGHPLEHIVFLVFGLGVSGVSLGGFLYLTGSTLHPQFPLCMVFVGLFAALMDKILHSELPLSLGPLDYIFMSARMHQIHHSAEARHRDKNFGGTLSVFDWMFGTAYRPTADESWRRGLSDAELGDKNPHRTLKALYLEPFVLAWSDIRSRWPKRE